MTKFETTKHSSRARMNGAGQDANRSAIANRALEIEPNHLKTSKEVSMDGAIRRLRASKQRFEEEETARGCQRGVEWAKLEAEYNQLCWLSLHDWDPEEGDGLRHASAVYGCLIGKYYEKLYDLEPDDMERFHSLFNLAVDTPDMFRITAEYVNGFIEGARSVWWKVHDEI